MKGRQKLRIAPVGELRRRWAFLAHSDAHLQSSGCESGGDVGDGFDDEDSGEVEWLSSSAFLRGSADPLAELRGAGITSRFWESDNLSMSSESEVPKSPSTASLCRIARKEGFSLEQIDEAARLLSLSGSRDKILDSVNPVKLDLPTSTARKIVTTLFEERKTAAGVWRGPLPRPRVSPPLTIADCPVKDQRSGSSARRRSPESNQKSQGGALQVSNSKQERKTDRPVPVRVWVDSKWVRFNLNPSVGRVLARRGKLAPQFRSQQSRTTLASAAITVSPSYAEVTRGKPMEGQQGFGAGQGMQGVGHGGGVQQGGGVPGVGYNQGGAPGQFFPNGNGGGNQGYQGGPGFQQNFGTGGNQGFQPPAQGFNNNQFQGQMQGAYPDGGFNHGQGQFGFQGNGQGCVHGAANQNNRQGFGFGGAEGVGFGPHGRFAPGYGGRGAGGRGWPRQHGRGRDRGCGRQGRGRGHVGQQQQYGRGTGQRVQGLQPGAPGSAPAVQVIPQPAAPVMTVENQGEQAGPVQQHTITQVAPGSSSNAMAQDKPPVSTVPPQKEQVEAEEIAKSKGKKIAANDAEGKPAKKSNNYCHRCRTKGHVSADCTAVLFCQICESDDHVAAKCSLKRNRPMAYMVGYGVDNLGFFHIPHGPFPTGKKDSTTALIRVHGGNLTEEQLVGQLKRLVPGNFEWDVQLHAPNAWVAPFPSKTDLKRAVAFGSADLKRGMSLKFEEFEEEEYFGDEICL